MVKFYQVLTEYEGSNLKRSDLIFSKIWKSLVIAPKATPLVKLIAV